MSDKNTNTKKSVDSFKISDLEKFDNTSKKIRFLSSEGYSTSEIYKILKHVGVTTKVGGEIRYQHVRNVLITPVGQ